MKISVKEEPPDSSQYLLADEVSAPEFGMFAQPLPGFHALEESKNFGLALKLIKPRLELLADMGV